MDAIVVIATCFTCKKTRAFDLECANTAKIDPVTGNPPDVSVNEEGAISIVTPTPEALARAVSEPICDACIPSIADRRGEIIPTMEERHRSRYGTPLGVHD